MYAANSVRHAAHELGRVVRADTDRHERFRRHVTTIVVLTLAIDIVCTLLAYLFEHDAKQTQITGIGKAFFWTTTQLLTVSSSYQNPLTTGGEILDIFLEVWAMIIVASLTASLGTFLVSRKSPTS